ncbi:6016_t:CDS:2 [Gigaspora margarita]|uniref:6016_t:CDS:1 n=1 Tax=Gigaspora margarita TaxID=4874 RepID=A0ABM8VXJ7_GIGMA|nr:6016_t:CDS:2 [Gigaspora margarita]
MTKPKVHTIPLTPKSITHRRLSRRATGSITASVQQSDKVYYGQITFGTGTPQNFDIDLDIGSGDLFVFGKNCVSPACNNHPKYDPDFDKTFSPIDRNFSIKYTDDTKISGIQARSLFELSVNGQTTPIMNLINNNKLDKPQFSFLLGREADKSPSELTIGGSNPVRYRADTLAFTNLVNNNTGAWEIPIDNCVIDGEELNTQDHKNGIYSLPCEDVHEVGLIFSGMAWYINLSDFTVEVTEDVCIGAVIYGNIIGSNTKWIIGSAFLKNVYTMFDQGNRQVGFAEIVHNN